MNRKADGMTEKNKDVEKILFTEEQIQEKVKEIGRRITEDYKDGNLLIVGIMKGAGIFMYDLIRQIRRPVRTDYMVLSSYGKSSVSSGTVTIKRNLDYDISGYHIILVEDIVDTGNTMAFLKEYLSSRGALSVKICSMLDKPARRIKPVVIDYCGFEVEDEFIVGYGCDYAEQYRYLPYFGILKKEIYLKD
ncbi:MAG: hypoxanthine phosphoribosyltransferase [Solobacterium sp.]|nr:hypoxanthine phosphoribosyltransferase [Solobacterium sp.]